MYFAYDLSSPWYGTQELGGTESKVTTNTEANAKLALSPKGWVGQVGCTS